MRTPKIFQKLVIISLLCMLLLTACSDAEWDIALDALLAWATGQGYIQNDEIQYGALAGGVMQGYVNEVSNEESAVQLDGLAVVDDYEDANAIAEEAMKYQDTTTMQEAIDLRPNDWSIHEKNAVLMADLGNDSSAESAFQKADSLVLQNLGPEDDCRSARVSQLEQRLENLRYQIMMRENDTGETSEVLKELEEQTQQELYGIYDSSSKPEFCP
ncbi:MAG: hypothetical protein MUO40_11170 [Anaerolineaceae bacterium]|nr:hypothetical protein [Anaerolineaceae bacterium]